MSTDNSIIRFDGTTDNVQNSSVTVTDTANIGVNNTNPPASVTVEDDPLWTIGTSPTPTAVASDTDGTVPTGTKYKITVSNGGTLQVSAV